jgi:hypothetical protein
VVAVWEGAIPSDAPIFGRALRAGPRHPT